MDDKQAAIKDIAKKVLSRAQGAGKAVGGAAGDFKRHVGRGAAGISGKGGTGPVTAAGRAGASVGKGALGVAEAAKKHPYVAAGAGAGVLAGGGALAMSKKKEPKTASVLAAQVLAKVASKCETPGEKIQSKGKGRGLAIGKGKGPLGVPVGDKIPGAEKTSAEIADRILKKVAASSEPISDEEKTRMLWLSGPIGAAMRAPKGEKVEAFNETYMPAMTGGLKGYGAGLGIGGAGGAGLGALAALLSKGRVRPGQGAIMGGVGGGLVGGLTGGTIGRHRGMKRGLESLQERSQQWPEQYGEE